MEGIGTALNGKRADCIREDPRPLPGTEEGETRGGLQRGFNNEKPVSEWWRGGRSRQERGEEAMKFKSFLWMVP